MKRSQGILVPLSRIEIQEKLIRRVYLPSLRIFSVCKRGSGQDETSTEDWKLYLKIELLENLGENAFAMAEIEKRNKTRKSLIESFETRSYTRVIMIAFLSLKTTKHRRCNFGTFRRCDS